MIKGIVGSGHIEISNNSGSFPYISPGSRSAGMVRWNENINELEVYDGTTWRPFSSSIPTIQLSHTASAAITWAIQKMAEEAQLKSLSEMHPAVKLAMENLEKAKQQLDVTIILSKEHDKTTS